MSETIVVALIALGGTLFSSTISAFIASKLMSYRIEQLEKKVDKHNNLIERMYKVEQDIALIKEKNVEEEKEIQEIKESVKQS